MQLRLGDTTFDLTTRGLYATSISAGNDVTSDVIAAATAGADLVIVSAAADGLAKVVQDAVASSPVPVAVRALGAEPRIYEREAALQAGAALWFHDLDRVTPGLLRDLARAKVSLAVETSAGSLDCQALMESATSAGFSSDRVAVVLAEESLLASAAQARTAGLASVVAIGEGPGRLGIQVATMMAGARIIETSDVREARRVGVTVSELLERRSLAS